MSLSSEYEDIRGTIRFSFMKWLLLLHVSKRMITSSVKTYFACLCRRLGMQHPRLTSCHVSMREWIRLLLMQIGLPLLQRLRPQRPSKTKCPILFKYRKCMLVGGIVTLRTMALILWNTSYMRQIRLCMLSNKVTCALQSNVKSSPTNHALQSNFKPLWRLCQQMNDRQ